MIEVVAAVIFNGDGKLFIASRPTDKPPAGWEFPGGKIEPGETAFDALKRELLEELAWEIEPLKELYMLRRENLSINFILARPLPGSTPAAQENQDFKWVDLSKEMPEGMLENDREFWIFLNHDKINFCQPPL